MTSRSAISAFIMAGIITAAPALSAQATKPTKTQSPPKAKVTLAEATATALKEVPKGTVVEHELEREDGKLIYSFAIKVPGKKGIEEVNVDAMTGAVVAREHESPEDEAEEGRKEGAERKPASQAELAKLATVAEPDARATALKAVPGGVVQSMRLERDGKSVVYSYDIIVTGKAGVEQVKIDGKSGAMASHQHAAKASIQKSGGGR